MLIQLVKIGNSRGVRLPRAVIEEAGLEDAVELRVQKGVITLKPVNATRAGWAEGARSCHEQGDDGALLSFANDFDAEW
ncbi:MAG: AbrB/MazE/SpoVT family DNA-binding domain-containing protein [Archangium sp.]|nr:AbrB/MazE/SpoVT family DNA-binding domain-containing protein [Archangium sp.]MDP3153666.1 AbrB/MazE/SpoVT family DNA-binding domain-containing protein [Archangium sp.]MDP3569286.1 AbrB/MazE/SpoVT family DNA-binding domain-containing protein [Archangium sp.]